MLFEFTCKVIRQQIKIKLLCQLSFLTGGINNMLVEIHLDLYFVKKFSLKCVAVLDCD